MLPAMLRLERRSSLAIHYPPVPDQIVVMPFFVSLGLPELPAVKLT
jgi:hypothetical protein